MKGGGGVWRGGGACLFSGPQQFTDGWREVDLYGCDKATVPSSRTFLTYVTKLQLYAVGTPCEDVFSVTTSVKAAPAGSWSGDGFHWLLSRWSGTCLAGCVIK